MSRELARWPAIVIALAPLFVGVVAGCTDDEDNTAPSATGPVCPITFAEANNGKACNTDGLSCDYLYACPGANSQQARCACGATGGSLKFTCTSAGDQGPIAVNAAPTCVPVTGGETETCPATTSAANGAECGTPGLQCTYNGLQCDGRTQLDYCFCKGNGAGSLSFVCEPATCGGEGGLPPPPPPRDAATEGG